MIIVDTTVYKSFIFIVEDGVHTFEVRMTENDVIDEWEITDDDGAVISIISELGKKLIEICAEQRLMS